MARDLYSTRFLAIGLQGAGTSYVVPAGFIAVVHTVSVVYIGGPTAAGAVVRAGGTNTPIAVVRNVNGYDQLQVSGRWVVDAGESISVACDSQNTAYFYVSGYLLTTP